MEKTLYWGGDVYSPADPFATAMLVDGESVAWVGSDEAARAVGDGARTVDLDGALVTPAFVDAWADVPSDPAAAAAAGVAVSHVTVRRGTGPGDGVDARTADVVYVDAAVDAAGAAEEWKTAVPGLTGLAARPADAGDIAAHIAAVTAAGLQARFETADDDELARVLSGYDSAAETVGAARLAAAGHRIDLAHAASDELLEGVNSRRMSVAVRPGVDPVRAARMISSGIPVAFGAHTSEAVDPWGAIRAAVFVSDRNERISARAAFTAHTRGGWRVAGRPGEGALVPGAAATFAVWAPTDLLVQVADERIAAWSTDPRSGTPGLPDLTDPEFRPTCLTTVLRGQRIHCADDVRSA